MNQRAFFVAGTDTDAGKTFVSAALLHAVANTGRSTLGLKPIASGCRETPVGRRNQDAEILMGAATCKLTYEQINPVALMAPTAPHIAAMWEGRRLSSERLVGFTRASLREADFTIVEGAGGWSVPLNQQETLATFAQTLGLPVILVVGVKLGCINHAVLTAQAIIRDGLSIAGWVANGYADDMLALRETLDCLREMIPAPCLGEVPKLSPANPALAAKYLDVSVLCS